MNRFIPMQKFVIFVTISIFIYPFLTGKVSAQSIPVSATGIELTASIDNPEPGQKVTLTARSYSADISASTITWTVNGKTVLKGVGENVLEIEAPALGKTLAIKVTASTPNGAVLSKSLSLKSGSVDMIVENSGYIPPLFKGKMPVSYQNTYKLIAIPHIANSSGVEYDPKTLTYQWKKNGQVIEDQSGYGRQTLTLTGDIVPRALNITVTASTRDQSLQTQGYASISFGPPSISFYVDDSLYGPLFNKTINDAVRIGTQRETGILAVPFGFNKPATGLGNLGLTWFINGLEYPDLSSNESVVLRAPDNTEGSSNIRLDIRNNKEILQGSSAGFSAVFTASQNSSSDIVNF